MRDGLYTKGEADKRIEVKEYEVGICEGFGDEGTLCLRQDTSCLRGPGGALGIEVVHNDAVITEIEKKVKVCHEIGRTG